MTAKTIKQSKALSWSEVDLKAVRHNLRVLRKLASENRFVLPGRPKLKNPVDILCVVKGDAYGHGMVEVSRALLKAGVNYFAVGDIFEGITLRKAGIKKPVLVMKNMLPGHVPDMLKHNLMPTICTEELAKSLNSMAKRKKKRARVHVLVDTGMGRLGVWHRDAFDFIRRLHAKYRNLEIYGLYTHFPAADTSPAFTRNQLKSLNGLIKKLDESGIVIPHIHAANSMGLAGYHTRFLNLVRPGLMIYGLYPKDSLKRKIPLKPVLSARARVIFTKTIEKGRSISYGRTFIAKRQMNVATVSIGYVDGYLRHFSNLASVLIKGARCKVLGRVTMDQIIVDISHVKNVKPGETATVLGKDKKSEVSAEELANLASTINYEVACSLGNRLPRIYK